MNFELTQNQLNAQKIARNFSESTLSEDILTRDATAEFPRHLYDEMGRMGLIGIPYPVEMGGQGGDYLSYIVSLEEISKVDASMGITYSVSTSLFCGVIMNSNLPAEKKAEFIRPVASGKALGSFALTEPNAGSDAAGCKTIAVKDGAEWVINGSKCFISNMGPSEGDFVTILAVTDPTKGYSGMSTIIVDRDTPGFIIGKREEKMGIRAADVSELIFENCRVPKSNLLGKEGKGFKIFMEALDGGRIGMASQALGIAEEALRLSKDYLKVRVQFGKPLEKQQGLQWYIADMATKVSAARALIYEAAMTMDRGENCTEIAAIAKYYASEIAVEVTNKALQIYSGYGYMRDYPLERMYRDARIVPIYEGTSEIQKNIIAREELKK